MRGKKTAATKKTNTSSAVKENDPEMIKLLEAKLREMTKSKKIANRISDSEPEDDESEGEDGLDEYEGGDGHEGLITQGLIENEDENGSDDNAKTVSIVITWN